MPDVVTFKKFERFDHINLDLKACLEQIEKDCEDAGPNTNKIELDKKVSIAFEKAKKTKAFRKMYCTNYLNGEINIDWDRKCFDEKMDLALSDFRKCEDFPVTADDDRVHTQCEYLLNQEMLKQVTPDIKKNYTDKIQKVINGFKEIYSHDPDIKEVLSRIAIETDFSYRLSELVAGQREPTDKELSIQCFDDNRPKWCYSDYLIVPGGRIFSDDASLELILAHEVGHVINDITMFEPELRSKAHQIKACAHAGSSILDIDKITTQGEGAADLHMAKYYHRFMKNQSSRTHFCHYPMDATFYIDDRQNHYLHPYHRQALINCYDKFKK